MVRGNSRTFANSGMRWIDKVQAGIIVLPPTPMELYEERIKMKTTSEIDKLGLHDWKTIAGDDQGLSEDDMELIWIAPYESKWTVENIASQTKDFAFAQLDSTEKWLRIVRPGVGWNAKREAGDFQ